MSSSAAIVSTPSHRFRKRRFSLAALGCWQPFRASSWSLTHNRHCANAGSGRPSHQTAQKNTLRCWNGASETRTENMLSPEKTFGQRPSASVIVKLLRNVYTRQSTGFRMRVQFIAAVILGLTLSPAPVFGYTCAAPPPEVKTASILVSLEVLHSYRGDQRKPIRLGTGLGGPGCAPSGRRVYA
jgi:hypothetical protein